jgi:hypothetical protein
MTFVRNGILEVALSMWVLRVCMPAAGAHANRAVEQPWWQRETTLSADGQLDLRSKPWWSRAEALKEGDRFTLDLNGDGRPDTIIARVDGDIVEAIDDTGHAAEIWNKVSTTYVVSFKGSGLVDRMVSYIDDDHEGAQAKWSCTTFERGIFATHGSATAMAAMLRASLP